MLRVSFVLNRQPKFVSFAATWVLLEKAGGGEGRGGRRAGGGGEAGERGVAGQLLSSVFFGDSFQIGESLLSLYF